MHTNWRLSGNTFVWVSKWKVLLDLCHTAENESKYDYCHFARAKCLSVISLEPPKLACAFIVGIPVERSRHVRRV